MSSKDESIGQELFIEELSDVRGGVAWDGINFVTFGIGKGEDGILPPPGGGATKLPGLVSSPVPETTTLMVGGAESSIVPPIPKPR